jgi:hypothetical protein
MYQGIGQRTRHSKMLIVQAAEGILIVDNIMDIWRKVFENPKIYGGLRTIFP